MDGQGTSAAYDLGALYAEHHTRLVNIASQLTRTRADAEDAVQEAFLVAMAKVDEVRPAEPVGWLVAITRNQALASTVRYRRTTAAGEAMEWQPEADTAPDTNRGICMGDPEVAEVVRLTLASVPRRQAEALSLWALDGLTWEEIERRMGIERRSAQRAARACLARLRAAAA